MLFLACVLAAAAPTEAAAAGRGLARRAATLPDPAYLRVATWNVAAINNNPFEYWITHDDPKYNQMMQDVQAFLDEPGAADVAVSTVLTEAAREREGRGERRRRAAPASLRPSRGTGDAG